MKYWRKPLDKDWIKYNQYQIHVFQERCKGCELCIEFCPRQVLQKSEEFNSKGYHPAYADKDSECLGCCLCELICPEFAIAVITNKEELAHE